MPADVPHGNTEQVGRAVTIHITDAISAAHHFATGNVRGLRRQQRFAPTLASKEHPAIGTSVQQVAGAITIQIEDQRGARGRGSGLRRGKGMTCERARRPGTRRQTEQHVLVAIAIEVADTRCHCAICIAEIRYPLRHRRGDRSAHEQGTQRRCASRRS